MDSCHNDYIVSMPTIDSYPRQHRRRVVLWVPKSFIDRTLWPEYPQIEKALHEYQNEATGRIIRGEVFGNSDEAEERTG